ncbi:MAG: hypothetical protein P8J68_00815 [Arenicellaceae bacterium]|nr:hypothetical protein [Arenicellaceae bacterium]
MKNYLLLSVLALSIGGCATSFEGRLDLNESFTFVDLSAKQLQARTECQALENQYSKKCVNLAGQIDKKTTVIRAGLYEADIVERKDELTLKILRPGTSRKLVEVPISTANSSGLPDYSGKISLTPRQTGRSFGIEGTFDTNELETETIHATEQCSFQVPYQSCGYVTVKDPNSEQPKQIYQCRTRYETYYGAQDVAFFFRHKNKEVFLDLVKADGRVIGEYNGTNQTGNKVYLYQGYCNTGYGNGFRNGYY